MLVTRSPQPVHIICTVRVGHGGATHDCGCRLRVTVTSSRGAILPGMLKTRCGALLVLATLAPISSAGQDFRERIEVKLIEVEVVVTDVAGNRVHGLSAADFELLEGGKRQEITNFNEHRHSAEALPDGLPGPTPPGHVAVLVDWLPRTRFVRTNVFEQLAELLPVLAREGHTVSLTFWNPGLDRLHTFLEPTSDATQLRDAVERLSRASHVANREHGAQEDLELMDDFMDESAADFADVPAPFNASVEKQANGRFASEMELMRFRRKSRAIRQLVSSTGGATGRKAFLYVSNEFSIPVMGQERVTKLILLDDLVETAHAAGVALYTVRPQSADEENGGQAAMLTHLDALQRIALPTGGLVDFGLGSVLEMGRTITADLSSYYSLAYRAKSDGRDRTRPITVRVKNDQYTVRTRRAVVEKSDETLARDAVTAALFGEPLTGSLTFTVVTSHSKAAGSKRRKVPVVLRIPTNQLQFDRERRQHVAHLRVMVQAANGVSEQTALNDSGLRIIGGVHDRQGFITYSFELLAEDRGSLVAIGIFDRRSGLYGVQTVDLRDVPAQTE